MADKDVLGNIIQASHDSRLAKLDAQEDLLFTGCSLNQESVTKNMQKAEINRNRGRVEEIIALVEKCMAEIDMAESY